MHLDGNHRAVGRASLTGVGWEQPWMHLDELRCGPNRSQATLIGNCLEPEPPPAGTVGDRRLVGILERDTRGREDAAVIRAARSRAMRVDRAAAVDEHRATTAIVEAEHLVTRQSRGRREQGVRDVRKDIGLVRPDVDELRRGAAAAAVPAGDVRVALSA